MIFETAQSVVGVALLALLLELFVGWPRWLHQAVGHPVVWMGFAIEKFEGLLRRDRPSTTAEELFDGGVVVLLMCALGIFAGLLIGLFLNDGLLGQFILVFLTASLFAARNLYDHVARVHRVLTAGSLEQARNEVSWIVGRDTKDMDESEICRAAIESLAESTSDGVVAPLFWFLILSFPGLVFYKVVNTMDSMIGYKNEKYLYFGRVAARLDDFVNLVPARLTAVIYLAVGRHFSVTSLQRVARDARQHDSPNAGWPEAAMALCLAIQLGGERQYNGVNHSVPGMNQLAPAPLEQSLASALCLYQRLVCLLVVMLGIMLWLLM